MTCLQGAIFHFIVCTSMQPTSIIKLLVFNLIDFETELNSHVTYSEVTFYLLRACYYSCPFALFKKIIPLHQANSCFFLSDKLFGFCMNRQWHLLKKLI